MKDPYTGEQATLQFTAKDNRGIPGNFDYYRSRSGHVFIGEVPNNLGDHYEGGYQTIPQDEAELADMARGEAYRLDPIRALVPTGRFLEIGPWIGLVAYNAHKLGYDVTVLEQDARCCALLRRVGIDPIQTSDPAEALQELGQRFDVIVLWHSIEHVPRPWDVIDRAARSLNDGGVLLIAAPNPESVQMRLFGEHWYHLDAPRHLHLLPASMMESIAAARGLEMVDCTSRDHLGNLLNASGWAFEAQRRAKLLPFARKFLLRPIRFVLRKTLRASGKMDGAGFTLIMRKPPAIV